ncbi:hypothetical protein [Cypionkella sp.]|uniref:hypothetical protein n=1 Tax=Cypionkella sp. TaxID=2811411 RepID=UPI002AB8CD77|nr:hypothetical protein [Cypionkella sp.]MDZ4392286.1 hypothetical protein [Cypionkella sp.]
MGGPFASLAHRCTKLQGKVLIYVSPALLFPTSLTGICHLLEKPYTMTEKPDFLFPSAFTILFSLIEFAAALT